MSEKVILIPNGEKIYAVPVEVFDKYELSGDKFTSAKNVLEGAGDVEGQSWMGRPMGAYFTMDNDEGPSYTYRGSGTSIEI